MIALQVFAGGALVLVALGLFVAIIGSALQLPGWRDDEGGRYH